MKPESEKDNLLADILSDETAPDFRTASLERTLASVRQRRRHRTIQRAGVVFIAAVTLCALTFWKFHNAQPQLQNSIAQSEQKPIVVPGTNIRIINDDELLAMFPDRPVALIGPPGDQQFVFLDAVRKPSQPEQRL